MVSESLLPEFDREMANTRKVLERCPEDKFGWKPHPKSFSMGALATHLARMQKWAVLSMQQDSFDVAPAGKPPYKEDPATSRSERLAQLAVYLRLNDVPVPALYGPSADEQE